jgi:hypothetical protein
MRITEKQIRNAVKLAMNEQAFRSRPIYEIADEISQLWKNVNYAAVPYLQAMQSISSATDTYGLDDGESIVLYFLANAGTWKGPDAKRLKDELRAALKAA